MTWPPQGPPLAQTARSANGAQIRLGRKVWRLSAFFTTFFQLFHARPFGGANQNDVRDLEAHWLKSASRRRLACASTSRTPRLAQARCCAPLAQADRWLTGTRYPALRRVFFFFFLASHPFLSFVETRSSAKHRMAPDREWIPNYFLGRVFRAKTIFLLTVSTPGSGRKKKICFARPILWDRNSNSRLTKQGERNSFFLFQYPRFPHAEGETRRGKGWNF